MAALKMEALKPPGLRPIKQVQLFKKIRPYVPCEHWAKLCPEPSEEIMNVVKHEKSDKIKLKLVGASEATFIRKETKKRIQNAAFLRKQTAKAECAQKKAERESIEAAAVVKRKDVKDKKTAGCCLSGRESAAQAGSKEKRGITNHAPLTAQQTKEVRMMMMIR
jgi:hypothetical protein